MNTGSIEAIPEETTIHTIEGINRYEINSGVVTFLPIHSIVVVTSPIGDHAPPALAAIIIIPAYHNLKFLFDTTFCKIEISTIVAVRLSIIADKIPKVLKRLFLVRTLVIKIFVKMLFVKKNNVKKILINRDGAFGDSVVALPALSVIRKNFPSAKIDLITFSDHGITFSDFDLEDNLVN